ncbi:hypothetical protein ACQPZF_00965 [Actinosynnema sp. CS-041913]|uniref:hypothetical protein n=1 Tax=Actinosynnema sp. CS-041913 TaxID=3239917 RepID=UPI003D8CD3D1
MTHRISRDTAPAHLQTPHHLRALLAVIGHGVARPTPTAPADDRAHWWFVLGDLWREFARKTGDPFAWETAHDLAEHADQQAHRITDGIPVRPWPADAGRPRIVCISGSMRFEEQMRVAAVEESLAGRIVLMPHVNTTRPLPVSLPAGCDPKPGLDTLHLAKIDLADELLVIAPGGYIGESTREEIAYAHRQGKPVRSPVPPAVA